MPVTRTGGLASFRLAARLARRETFRRPGRTLLVALLVAIPVAGMVVADVWIRTEKQTPAQEWRGEWGNADLVFYGQPHAVYPESGAPSVESHLPKGSRMLSYRSDWRILRSSEGARSQAEVTDLPMTDPMTAPIMQIMRGRAPSTAGEVFLARAVATDLGVDVGDALVLEHPARVEWQVAGVGEIRRWWGSNRVVLAPGTPFPWRPHPNATSTNILVDLPDTVTPAQLKALAPSQVDFPTAPWLPAETTYYSDYNVTGEVAWSWVAGAIALTVAGIVIAAAFAASARRQLITLGQLAANGAPPSALRRVLFLQGTWTGALGVVLGLALAVAALVVFAPHADGFFGKDVDPYPVHLVDLIPILVLGMVAATVAAMVPAYTTARVSILAALAGRRPLHPVPRWVTAVGVAVSGGGLALFGLVVSANNRGTVFTLAAIVGGMAVLLGACATTPRYVSVLEPLAARLIGSSRLAARSLYRQRTRTAAVVAAVCAASALAIAASTFMLTESTRYDNEPNLIRDDEVQLLAIRKPAALPEGEAATFFPVIAEVPTGFVDDIRAAIPDAEVHQLDIAVPAGGLYYGQWSLTEFIPEHDDGNKEALSSFGDGPHSDMAMIADDEFLDLYNLPAAARRALADDGAVAFANLSGTGSIALGEIPTPEQETARPPGFVEIAPFPITIVADADLGLGRNTEVLLTHDRAQELGLELTRGPIVVRAPEPLTEDQRTALWVANEDRRDLELDEEATSGMKSGVLSIDMQMSYEQNRVNTLLLEALLSAAALVLSLFVVATSLALAAAETRDERDVLVVVGAPPKTMRHTSGYKALFLTFLGTALAVPVGFLPLAVLTIVNDQDLSLQFPWRAALLLLLVTPLAAGAITTAVSGLALRIRPVRISTMDLD